MSLRTKLFLAFAAIAIIPLVLENIITSRIAEQAMTRSVFEKNRLLAQNIADDVDQMFAEKIRMLKIAAANTDIKSMNSSKQLPVLRNIVAQHPDLLIIIAVTPNGDLLTRSDGTRSRINYRDRDYFKTVTGTGATAISDVIVSRTTGKLGIAIAEPIKNEDQTLRGMLVLNVNLQKIIARIAETRIGATGYAYVVNKEGKVLMHPDRSLVENAADFSNLAPVKAAISGKTGWAEYEFRGQKKLGGYSYVPTTGWGLVAQQPLDEAMADVAAVRRTNIIIMACTAAIAFLIVLALTGALFKPIALLTAAAGKVAEGDLTAQAGFTSTDEIGALAATFNNMTTQLRNREEELRKYHEHLEDLVKERTEALEEANTELTQYAYVVSHDLRAPLRAIHNYADFLREDLEATLSGDQKKYLDAMGRVVKEAEVLVEDVLELSRVSRSSVHIEKIDIAAFMRRLIASLDLPAEVQVIMAGDWPTIDAEPTLLRQIFQNLITNAVKFNTSPDKRVELGWRARGENEYEFFVRDNGIGIDPRYHEQIFRVFERLHSRDEFEGTGAGLAIVKKAAARLHGTVRVESEAGKGSAFFVTIPKMQ